jgi:hypothetical protein
VKNNILVAGEKECSINRCKYEGLITADDSFLPAGEIFCNVINFSSSRWRIIFLIAGEIIELIAGET